MDTIKSAKVAYRGNVNTLVYNQELNIRNKIGQVRCWLEITEVANGLPYP